MKSVLLIGEDATLLANRAAVLAHTGASVAYCLTSEFERHATAGAFSVVVLCHTLNADARRAFTDTAHRRWPEGKVLQLSTDFYAQPSLPGSQADAFAAASPRTLIQATMQLLDPPTLPPG